LFKPFLVSVLVYFSFKIPYFMLKRFDLAYSAFYNTITAPILFCFSKSNLPKTVFFSLMMLLTVSCHNSVPYNTEQSTQFVDSLGISTELPKFSSRDNDPYRDVKVPALTSDDSLVIENPEAYSKRVLDSAKTALITKSRDLATPPPIEEVKYDTIELVSPAEKPAKPMKSPAEKLARANKSPAGIPATSTVEETAVDQKNTIRPLVVKPIVEKRVYNCRCSEKVAIQEKTTAISFVAVMRATHPSLTVEKLASINKPNVVKNWKVGTFICLKRASK
jgi:hypothetical protein